MKAFIWTKRIGKRTIVAAVILSLVSSRIWEVPYVGTKVRPWKARFKPLDVVLPV